MARLISAASGNVTTAATWQVADATSLLDSEAGNTALTTAYVLSQTFTTGATIDGIALKLASRAASPTGTMTVALDQAGSDVAGTVVTVNVSDLPACSAAQNEGGWVFFKFATPAAAGTYSVKAKTSAATQVNLYRNATAGNWSRLPRTTTTAAPGAGDNLVIIGEKTGAGTGNTFAITFDNTANITLGTGCDTGAPLSIITGALCVGNGGTLNGGSAAATAYLLQLAGSFIAYSGSTVNLWRAATLPTDSTATITFTCVASGDFGIVARNASTVSIGPAADPQGRTARGALLAADAAVAATALTLDGSYGWLNGDSIAIASTASVSAYQGATEQSELRTLGGNESGTGLTISAGLTYAHLGDTTGSYTDPDIGVTFAIPRPAEVPNLSGQITIASTNSALGFFIWGSNTAVVIIEWVVLRYLGLATGLTGRRGVEVDTTTGSFTLRNCAIRDGLGLMAYIGSANAAWGNVTITKLVTYNCTLPASNQDAMIDIRPTTSTNWTVDDWMIVKNVGNNGGHGCRFQALGGTMFKTKPCRVGGHMGYYYPIQFANAHNTATQGCNPGSFIAHSSNCFGGIKLDQIYQGPITFDSLYTWGCVMGIYMSGTTFRVLDAKSFGDAGFAFGCDAGGRIEVEKLLIAGNAAQAATQGVWIDDVAGYDIRIRNAVISPNSGNLKPVQNALSLMFPAITTARITFEKCSIAKGGGIFYDYANVNSGTLEEGSYIAFEGLTGIGTAGTKGLIATGFSQLAMVGSGHIALDSTIQRNSASTMRITQGVASKTVKHAPVGKGILVPSKRTGGTLVGQTGSIDLRTSVVGDGAAYNGSAPAIYVRENPALGITSDTLLATMSGSAGTWNATAFTLPIPTADGAYELFVAAGGAVSPAGWVNVSSLAAS